MNLVKRVLWFFYGNRTPTPREVPKPHALDALCERFACRYERAVFPTGEVQVRLIRADATLSAVGPTTAAAVESLVKKATTCWSEL